MIHRLAAPALLLALLASDAEAQVPVCVIWPWSDAPYYWGQGSLIEALMVNTGSQECSFYVQIDVTYEGDLYEGDRSPLMSLEPAESASEPEPSEWFRDLFPVSGLTGDCEYSVWVKSKPSGTGSWVWTEYGPSPC